MPRFSWGSFWTGFAACYLIAAAAFGIWGYKTSGNGDVVGSVAMGLMWLKMFSVIWR